MLVSSKCVLSPPTTTTLSLLRDNLLITSCSLVWFLWAVGVMINLCWGRHVQGGKKKEVQEVKHVMEDVQPTFRCSHKKGAYPQTGQASPHCLTQSETPHCTPIHMFLADLKNGEGDCNTHTLIRLAFYRSTAPSPSFYFATVPEIPHKASKRADPEGLLHSHSL